MAHREGFLEKIIFIFQIKFIGKFFSPGVVLDLISALAYRPIAIKMPATIARTAIISWSPEKLK